MKHSITSFLCLTASCIALATSAAHAQTTTLKKAKATTSGVSTINGNKLANPLPLPTNEYTGPGVAFGLHGQKLISPLPMPEREYTGPGVSSEEPIVCQATCTGGGPLNDVRLTVTLGNGLVVNASRAEASTPAGCTAGVLEGGFNNATPICFPVGDPRHCDVVSITGGAGSSGFTGPVNVNCPN
jgi:hypothetical protein